MVLVDAPGRMMCRRDAARDPILKAAEFAQPGGHGAHAGARLSLELHEVDFLDAPLGPEVRGQTDLREGVAVHVEGQSLRSS